MIPRTHGEQPVLRLLLQSQEKNWTQWLMVCAEEPEKKGHVGRRRSTKRCPVLVGSYVGKHHEINAASVFKREL